MPYTPYISNEEFRNYSGGVNVTKIPDTELLAILDAASRMVDGYCRTSFQYRQIDEEVHDWRYREQGFDVGWEVYPYYLPVRSISKFFIAVGTNSQSGEYVGADVPVLPVRKTANATGTNPPRAFGSVFVDNSRGFVQTTAGTLNFNPFIQIFPNTMQPVSVVLSYTAGYDSGTVQSDGYSVPFPDWLTQATRMIGAEVAAQRFIGQSGMLGLQSLRVGDVHMAQMSGRLRGADPHSSIPADAKELLRPHQRIVMA